MHILLLILVIASIVFGAIGDSRFDYGKKHHIPKAIDRGKFFKDAEILALLSLSIPILISQHLDSSPHYFYMVWHLFAGYACIRFGIFDYVYAFLRNDVKWHYIGQTGWYAKFWKMVDPPPLPILFGRGVILLAGLFITVRTLL